MSNLRSRSGVLGFFGLLVPALLLINPSGVLLWAALLGGTLLPSFARRRRYLVSKPQLYAVLLALSAPSLMAPVDVTLSNAPDAIDGTNLNAQNIANTLLFTEITILADNSFTVTENVDLSNTLYGAPNFGLSISSQIFNLYGNVTMGNNGVSLSVVTANLQALLFDLNGILLDDSKLNDNFAATGVTGTVNVASTASLDQAIDLSAIGATVSVLDGLYLDVILDKSVVFELQGDTEASFENGLLDATELRALGSSLLTITGSGFEVDTGGGFAPVGAGQLAALTGTLRGTLESGDFFETTFLQGGGGFTGAIVLVPEPSTAVLLAVGLAALAVRRRI